MILWLLACDTQRDVAELDPASCVECHPAQYQEWEGSMHAHAADDPVFLALNAKAVATDGVPEDFCVSCHAPVALALGETQDGLNLESVPQSMKGVGCTFCHQLEEATGPANGAVSWVWDGVMRGALEDPLKTDAHKNAYGAALDRDAPESSQVCGSCHDVVLPSGLHLEQTYVEWEASVFSEGLSRQSCGHCHLPSRPGLAAEVDGAQSRRIHDHSMPGVDVALVPWADAERQKALVQELLDKTLLAELCVVPEAAGSKVVLTLENVLAGHNFPSGASHDRRVWVEVRGFSEGAQVLSSGEVSETQSVMALQQADLVLLHDEALTAEGEISHGIVDAVSVSRRGLEAPENLGLPHARSYAWSVPGQALDQVDVRVRMRPVGLDLLQPLLDDGGITPAQVQAMPTFDLGSTVLHWEGELGSCVGGQQ
jgi:nitrate/TMAO reductase-like tetraheme cytochrome c subunit